MKNDSTLLPGRVRAVIRTVSRSGAWVLLAFCASLLAQDSQSAEDPPQPAPEQSAAANALTDMFTVGGEFRTRFESRQGLAYRKGSNDSYTLVRLRIDIAVKPAEWLEFGFQGQDSRAPGIREVPALGAFEDEFDVRQAHVRIGRADAPVTLTVGRQLLAYGDQRLVGALDWSNTSRVFDAIKLATQAGSVKVDVFSASVVQNDPTRRLNQSLEGNNIHGIYAAIEDVIPKSTIEPYVLWQTTPMTVNELQMRGDMDRYTTGTRIWGRGLGPWDYNAALVAQRGNLAGAAIEAWAYYTELGYSLDRKLEPRLFAEYNFGSGDDDPADGKVGGFVDVYPTAHRWYGYNDLVGWRNIKNLRLGTQLQAHEKLGLQFDFHSFWLVTDHDALYNVGGRLTVPAPAGGIANKKVGDEFNVTFSSSPTERIGLSGGIGYMFPGPFLKANTPGYGNTFSFLALAVKF